MDINGARRGARRRRLGRPGPHAGMRVQCREKASDQLTDERTAKRARVDAALTMTTRGADNDVALYDAAAKARRGRARAARHRRQGPRHERRLDPLLVAAAEGTTRPCARCSTPAQTRSRQTTASPRCSSRPSALDRAPLLGAGADKDLAKNNGATPLLIAASAARTVVRVLLDAGADKDLAANDGATPLYIAAREGHERPARAAGRGADKDLAMHDGATPCTS